MRPPNLAIDAEVKRYAIALEKRGTWYLDVTEREALWKELVI
jgi:hypothetical protein